MVIVNAVPKLKKHSNLFDQACSPEVRDSMEFIYDTWILSDHSAAPASGIPNLGPTSLPRPTSTPSNRPSNSKCSRLGSQYSGCNQRGMGGYSNGSGNSAGGNSSGTLGSQRKTDKQIDSDGVEFLGSRGSSRSALSISVPDESFTTLDQAISPDADHSPKFRETSARVFPTVRMPKDVEDWANCVNVALEDDELSTINNLPEQLEYYTAEPARTPWRHTWETGTNEHQSLLRGMCCYLNSANEGSSRATTGWRL